MRAHRRVYVGLALVGPAVIAVAVTAISLVVYRQVSANMTEQTEEILYGRLQIADQTILNVFYEASRSASVLLLNAVTAPANRGGSEQNLRQLVADIPGAIRAWVVLASGEVIYGPMTCRAYLERATWWSGYRAGDMQRGISLFTGQDAAGMIGTPYRDELDLDTIVPILVYRFQGVEPIATAYVEIDITQVLALYLHDFAIGRVSAPKGDSSSLADADNRVSLSIYDADGNLIDSTANLPMMSAPPLVPSTRLHLPQDARRRLYSGRPVSVVSRDFVELFGRDAKTGLVFETRVPRSSIVSGVAKITLNILGIGLVSLVGIMLLGAFLVRAIRRMKSFEEQQMSTRLEMLQAKMNPHFLFNTLDSMVGVATRNDRTTLLEMLRSLSYILHMSVRKKEDLITLEEELEYVESYVRLQRVRYAESFSFALSVDESLLDLFVYRFSIQPLVENSFVHGVAEVPQKKVRISVRVERGDRAIRVTESDTGPGCSTEVAERLARLFQDGHNGSAAHIGLSSVHGRLRAMHGKGYGLRLVPSSEGFAIQAIMPIIRSPERWNP